MKENIKNALIIFARKPELGKVKTRLAATIGNNKALDIYTKLLIHTRAVVKAVVNVGDDRDVANIHRCNSGVPVRARLACLMLQVHT